MNRQCSLETLAFDASDLGHFGDGLSLGDVAQGDEQNAGLLLIFQYSFEILGSKFRVLPEPSNDGLVVRDAGLGDSGGWALRFMKFQSFLCNL